MPGDTATRLGSLFRFWTTFERPVDRRDYLVHGAGLMVFKYLVDATVVRLATGTLWTPWSYLRTSPLELASTLDEAPVYLGPLLAAWTLPFLWIGVCMTMRRLVDARHSAWWSLLFFVPPISYVLMAVLAILPSREPVPSDAPDPGAPKSPAALLSMAIGAALGLALLYVGTIALNSYGIALFLGSPFAVGAVTGFMLCRRYPATVRETLEVVVMTLFLIAGGALALGWEGVVCLLMALPLGIVLALLGGAFGRALARRAAGLRSIFLVPTILIGGAAGEDRSAPGALREVRSSITVDAPPSAVWAHVVAFPPLPEPEETLFRLGVAYPTHARIEGSGVGAIRYCEFSTGPFVEPITAWERDRRLAFDVIESPQPLRELSPYEIKPPHLHGFLVPVRGEFRLIPLEGGGTRLEGSTWYHQSLKPDAYWTLFSDFIIRRIHQRVLEHIGAEAEAETAVQPGPVSFRGRLASATSSQAPTIGTGVP